MRTGVSFTERLAAVSIGLNKAVAAHRGRIARAARAARRLVRIAPSLALLGAASVAAAQQPAPGEWGMRAPTLQPLSELALAEANGKLYLMGGYPPNRVTVTTVQVYDIATDTWSYGPSLPVRNNHGMGASVNGKIYLIGGQLNADDPPGTDSYVNTVYELDPAVGVWLKKAEMPTARSSGFAVALDGKIYVAGGRLPRGSDFAVFDPIANSWEVLPNLPTQRNHFTGAAINGRIHYVGGRQGNGLSPLMTTAHEVFDPQTRTWTTAAPMLRPRSGMNGIMARGLFHVWGGEGPAGMFHDHDYYNPQTNTWTELPDMPMAVHGIVGSAFVNDLIWVTGGGTGIGGSSGSTMNQVYRPAVGISSGSPKADFNGDDHADIVWQNNQTGERAIWLMNETTWVGERFLPTVPLEWQIAATGDFNGDQQTDIVWQNSQTGVRAIWLMNGTTWVGERFLPTIPIDWQIVGSGDFNADGHTDLVWQSSVLGARAIWLMNGTQWVGERFLPPGGNTWIAGAGDFNRDGRPDLITQNLTDGRRAILLMNGTTVSEERQLPTIPTEWRIAGVGDFNRDGNSDVIWQHSGTGQRAIWLMDQSTWVGERFLPVIPVSWDIRNH